MMVGTPKKVKEMLPGLCSKLCIALFYPNFSPFSTAFLHFLAFFCKKSLQGAPKRSNMRPPTCPEQAAKQDSGVAQRESG